MFLALRRIETCTCWPNKTKVRVWPQVFVMMQRSDLTLKCQIYPLWLETDSIGQVDGCTTWIPAGYGIQKMFFTLQHYSYRPVAWNNLEEVTNQNWWYSGPGRPRYAYLKSFSAIGSLWPNFFGLLDFSKLFQWRGHDLNLVSDLMTPNKEILDMHFVIAQGLTPHARFQNPRS